MRLAVLDRVCYVLEMAHRDCARPIEAVRDPDRVDPAVKEVFALF